MELSSYSVTLLTLTSAAPTGTSPATAYIPYYLQKAKISFASATQSTVSIVDDDAMFQSMSVEVLDTTAQTLKDAVTFGSLPGTAETPAGTPLTYWHGTLIQELTAGGLPTGNFFRLQFPVDSDTNILGGKTALMVIPVGKTDSATGTITYPEFNRLADYKYVQGSTVGSIQTNQISYGVEGVPLGAPCFTSGTLIDTAEGPRRIETLAAGDHIRTRDHGLRRLQWVGSKPLDARALDLNPALRPIVIAPGALGSGLPRYRLTVSPQHRVLINVARLPGGVPGGERLIAAKHLVGLPGITVANPPEGVTYWHLLFDGHELVKSNGAWTESLYTGREALRALTPAARREITALFPALLRHGPPPAAARPFLTGRQGRALVRRHTRTGKTLIES